MPLESPNLDDRTWRDLVGSATARIHQEAPEWSDLSPGDPGIVLLEVFAYLTESLLYRLNRVPDKLFIEFLRLIGVRLQPPAAASVSLVFTRERGTTAAVEIPRGTHVTIARPGGGEPPVFETTESGTIASGEESVTVRALQAERIEAESLGQASGDPGLVVTVARPPIIASTGDGLDLIVAVEVDPSELEDGDPAIEHGGRTYRVWREVDNFTYLGADRFVYLADRMAGSIMFAPAARSNDDDAVLADEREVVLADTPEALAATPPRGRDILVSYRRGGGVEGNVAAGTLTTIKEPIRATVTNPEPAAGGRAAESLDNARIRGPQELHTLSRAVTARDFQLAAERASGAVVRAKAVTQAELWRYATPGTVELFLVPNLPDGNDPAMVTAEQLTAIQTQDVLDAVRAVLDARRSLGTTLAGRLGALQDGPRPGRDRRPSRGGPRRGPAPGRPAAPCDGQPAPDAAQRGRLPVRPVAVRLEHLQDHPVRAGRPVREGGGAGRRRGPERGGQGARRGSLPAEDLVRGQRPGAVPDAQRR